MDSAACRIRETGTGLMVPLHVQPRARRTQIAGIHNGALKVQISSPPVDDAANRALVEYFSKMLELPKSHVQIVAGPKSRDKLLHITGVSLQTFQALLRKFP